MKDYLFSKTIFYESNLTPNEIKENLLNLLNDPHNKKIPFAGRVDLLKFRITPILGPRQNFKITILGKITYYGLSRVEIKYTLSNMLFFIIYGLLILYLVGGLILYFIKFNLILFDFTLWQFYPFIAWLITVLIFRLVYISQYKYYSEFVSNILNLKKII